MKNNMKKGVSVLVLALAVVGGASALDLSAGLLLGPKFGSATDSDAKFSYFDFGFGAFFDATYAEVHLGMDLVTPYYDGTKGDDSINYFTLGLLGKYPVAIGDKFTIAPAIGFDYQIFLSSGEYKRSDDEDPAKNIDNFILKFGVVADFSITEHLYVRGEALGAFGFAHKDREDSTFGADILLGVGYKF